MTTEMIQNIERYILNMKPGEQVPIALKVKNPELFTEIGKLMMYSEMAISKNIEYTFSDDYKYFKRTR
jgi:hypothetical protein